MEKSCISNRIRRVVYGSQVAALTALFLFFASISAQTSWTCATNSADWSVRCQHASVVFDNKMWLLKGLSGDVKDDIWYSTDGANWIQATDSAPFLARIDFTCVNYNGAMWVIGGS